MTEDDGWVITASYDKHVLTVWRRDRRNGNLTFANAVGDDQGYNGNHPQACPNDGLMHPERLAMVGTHLYVASSSWCRHLGHVEWAKWCKVHDDALAVYDFDAAGGLLTFIESHERREGYDHSKYRESGASRGLEG